MCENKMCMSGRLEVPPPFLLKGLIDTIKNYFNHFNHTFLDQKFLLLTYIFEFSERNEAVFVLAVYR